MAKVAVRYVQDSKIAKFDTMPASVLARKLADGVDKPESLAPLILEMRSENPKKPLRNHPFATVGDRYETIFSIVKSRYDIDFSIYKPTNMERRIKRRMSLIGAPSPTDYPDMLSINRAEVANLLKDLLVDDTLLFRASEVRTEYASRRRFVAWRCSASAIC